MLGITLGSELGLEERDGLALGVELGLLLESDGLALGTELGWLLGMILGK